MLIWIFLVTTILVYFYQTVKRKQSYWADRGIPYMKPKFLLGNTEIIQSECATERIKTFYNYFPETRYHGGYMFMTPLLVVKDIDLAKVILIKEFDHFVDRRTVASNETDPFWAKNLVNSQGERWRDLRAALSPTFTSSKLKTMFTLINNCALQFVEYFENQANDVEEVEMKDAFSRFTNDVVATTVFGLECNSFRERKNEFYLMGKDITNLGIMRLIRYMVFTIAPTVTKILNIKVIPPYIANYFSKIIIDTVKLREEKNVVRPDMIHLLIQAKKGFQKEQESKVSEGFATVLEADILKNRRKVEITIDDIVAQCFLFFFAGFDTTSTLLTFTLYELALHPEIQDKLRKEAEEVQGDITYETLFSLQYLDMVISEGLRKWPPAAFTDRKVTKEFTIKPERPGEKPLKLEEGMLILVPIKGIHHDPKYYPEPEKFDPERFSEQNKHKINPMTFIPFGTGPRNCIGSRFALLEVKLLLYHVIKHFEVVPVKRTLIPMELDPKQFGPVAKGGMWLGLKKLKK